MESLAQTSREWQTKLDEMLKTQQEVVNKAVQEAQEEWHQVRYRTNSYFSTSKLRTIPNLLGFFFLGGVEQGID